MSDPVFGTIIGDKYQLGPVLGRGGMGVVREASHIRLGTKFAVKLMHETADPIERSRFEREALAASALHNRHVVRVFDIGVTASGTPYMVMERLRGRDANAIFRETPDLDVARVVDWMIQVCSAMYEAHLAGVVHRDLKPSNVFVVEGGTEELVKVVDFGISKVLSAQELTVQSSFVGTPQYMAPEQLRGERFDHRADLWAIGVITYRLLSKHYPFPIVEAASPIVAALANLTNEPIALDVVRPDLPPALVAAVMRALQRDPADRFADAHEMALALLPFGSGRVVFEEPGAEQPGPNLLERLQDATPMFNSTSSGAGPLSTTLAAHEVTASAEPAPAHPSPRRRHGVLVAAALLAVCAAGVIVWLVRGRAPEDPLPSMAASVTAEPSASTVVAPTLPALPATETSAADVASAAPAVTSAPSKAAGAKSPSKGGGGARGNSSTTSLPTHL